MSRMRIAVIYSILALLGLAIFLAQDAKADAVNGKTVYESMGCVFCHGYQGAGDGLMSAEMDPKPRDFTDAVVMSRISDATMFYNIRNGIKGTAMPAWGLTDTQIGDVIDYVRTFAYDYEITKTICINEPVTVDLEGRKWYYTLDTQYIDISVDDDGATFVPNVKGVRNHFKQTSHKLIRAHIYLTDGDDLYLVVVRVRDCYK